MGKKFGFSFSWKRAIGLSAAKGKLSRKLGVPLTKSGRERKAGRMVGSLFSIFPEKKTRRARVTRAASGGCVWGLAKVAALIIFLLFLLGLFIGPRNRGPGGSPSPASPQQAAHAGSYLPGVSAFLGEHPEFGTPSTSWDVPNWARGGRQGVQFSSGKKLLFYLKGDEVVTVYDVTPGSERKIVWGQTDSGAAPESAGEDETASDQSGMSAEYRAGLKRTAERRKARAAAGQRKFAEPVPTQP